MDNLKMTDLCVIFYVFDDLNRFFDSFTIYSNASYELKPIENNVSSTKIKKKFTTALKVDGYFLSVFGRVLIQSQIYSQMVINNLFKSLKVVPNGSPIRVKLKLVKPKLEVIDYGWNYKVDRLILIKQELEYAMSWLSTLGGAFSALGDSFENCAKTAGKISLHQLKIAFQLGEPLLVVRCKLYMALSFIQLGKLKLAKKMVLSQYELAKSFKDFRLQNMCKGIWAKLQYTHSLRKNNNK